MQQRPTAPDTNLEPYALLGGTDGRVLLEGPDTACILLWFVRCAEKPHGALSQESSPISEPGTATLRSGASSDQAAFSVQVRVR